MTENEAMVLLAAVRYMLGRQSYGVGMVIEHVTSRIPNMDAATRTLLAREIEEAANLGDPEVDAPRWRVLHAALIVEGMEMRTGESVSEVNVIYDLDGIEQAIRESVKGWPHPARFTRTPEKLTVSQPGLFPEVDRPQYCCVTAAGFCEIHWSFPKGMVIQGIVGDHRIAGQPADREGAIDASTTNLQQPPDN